MFEKITQTIKNTGEAVGTKAKQGSELAKSSIRISNEEKNLNDIYAEIGKRYYDNNSENPCCDEMKELCDKAAEKIALITELKRQVRALKGVIICTNCGAEVPDENDFCGKCGTKLEKPAPQPEAVEEEEVIDHEDNVEAVDEDDVPVINIEVAEDENADK